MVPPIIDVNVKVIQFSGELKPAGTGTNSLSPLIDLALQPYKVSVTIQ
jgi:hypothetical protein